MAILDHENTSVGATAIPSATNIGIDPSDPLYLHPSDNPKAMLVLVPFSGIGYRSWRRSVMRGLSVKNKLGFISGEYIADSVEYASNAVELWKELEGRYEQTNGARLYQIQKEINDLSQGVLDITGYYTKNEKQREIKPSDQMLLESASLSVNTSRPGSYKTNYAANNNSTRGNKPRPFCDYCKKLGHTKDKCYKLHGYPQNFGNSYTQNSNRGQNLNQAERFNKGRRIVASL
ncbi:PREDICTED: uncharacterized protein LOC109231589 [Nicotiana attenuata]|uniref:uncharacterized protein LOC109231589 n=1 Tax=Nicotiana attenuata TaxID=49451 RepID=UPI000904A5C9|nr:PREDICTED: uncharacterized protein LOC109231589 [Nicotiana attenuata]